MVTATIQDVMEPVDAADPWERRPGEPTLWYDRFQQFMLLGSHRTIEAASRACGLKASLYLRNRAQEWDWRARAAAWDTHQLKLQREQYELDRTENRRTRLELSRRVQQILDSEIDSIVWQGMAPDELVAILKTINNELRTDYDDLPAQRVQMSGKVDSEVTVTEQDPKEQLLRALELMAQRRATPPPTVEQLEPEQSDVIEGEARVTV